MKQIVITAKDFYREAKILLCCFLFCMTINAVAIVFYNTDWSELVSQLGLVFFLTVVFYAILAIGRMILFWARRKP